MRAVLVPLLFLVLAAPARASTAEVVVSSSCGADPSCEPSPVVTYRGAPGEASRLTVATDDQTLILTDPAPRCPGVRHLLPRAGQRPYRRRAGE